jgi:folylpolyglutamate synthase/dihydropteroate synthase
VHVAEGVASALEAVMAAARPTDLVLVTGSLFLVGEAMVWWRRSPR